MSTNKLRDRREPRYLQGAVYATTFLLSWAGWPQDYSWAEPWQGNQQKKPATRQQNQDPFFAVKKLISEKGGTTTITRIGNGDDYCIGCPVNQGTLFTYQARELYSALVTLYKKHGASLLNTALKNIVVKNNRAFRWCSFANWCPNTLFIGVNDANDVREEALGLRKSQVIPADVIRRKVDCYVSSSNSLVTYDMWRIG